MKEVLISSKCSPSSYEMDKSNTLKPKPKVDKAQTVIIPESASTEPFPPKRLSLKEKQEMRKREREMQVQLEKEREKMKADAPKAKMGADCESLLCSGCTTIVDEFGK